MSKSPSGLSWGQTPNVHQIVRNGDMRQIKMFDSDTLNMQTRGGMRQMSKVYNDTKMYDSEKLNMPTRGHVTNVC